jgi:hypothetical protein
VTGDGEQLTFLGRRLPPACRIHTVVLAPSAALDYRHRQWADALVVVERGTLEVECGSGARARFGAGAVLTFATVRPRRLLNPGMTPLLLSALIRSRAGDDGSAGPDPWPG